MSVATAEELEPFLLDLAAGVDSRPYLADWLEDREDGRSRAVRDAASPWDALEVFLPPSRVVSSIAECISYSATGEGPWTVGTERVQCGRVARTALRLNPGVPFTAFGLRAWNGGDELLHVDVWRCNASTTSRLYAITVGPQCHATNPADWRIPADSWLDVRVSGVGATPSVFVDLDARE